MPFPATCPGCGDERTVPDEGAGKRVRCRACGAAFWAGNADVEVVEDEPAGDGDRPPRSRGSDRDRSGRRGGEARRANPLPLVLGGVALLLVVGGLATAVAFLGPFGSRRTEPGSNPGAAAGGPSAGGTGPVAASPERIELSDPEAAVYPVDAGGERKLVLGWRVKYRFVEGGPRPGAWYYCEAQYPNGPVSLAEVPGRELKAEGVFQQENPLRPGQDRPGSLTLTAGAGGRGSYTKVSAAVTCPVTDRTGPASPGSGYDEHVRLSNAKAERRGDAVTVSFDIEFLNGSKADDTYFLVVWYPDKSYDKWALNRVADPRRYGAHPGAELIPPGATKGRITRDLAQPTGDMYSLSVQRRENLPGGRDGWPTVSNSLDVPAP